MVLQRIRADFRRVYGDGIQLPGFCQQTMDPQWSMPHRILYQIYLNLVGWNHQSPWGRLVWTFLGTSPKSSHCESLFRVFCCHESGMDRRKGSTLFRTQHWLWIEYFKRLGGFKGGSHLSHFGGGIFPIHQAGWTWSSHVDWNFIAYHSSKFFISPH